MKNRRRQVPTEFGPEIGFEVTPLPAALDRAVQGTELERLKHRLLDEHLAGEWLPQQISRLRRAANEAAALAWVAPFPLLVFPLLFEEKAELAQLQAERQNRVRRRSRELLVV